MVRAQQRYLVFGKSLLFAVLGVALIPGVAAAQNPAPYIDQVAFESVAVDGLDLTLDVFGSQFDQDAILLWDGENRVTTVISPGYLQVVIPANDITVSRIADVAVMNSDGQISNDVTFVIGDALPMPVLTSINPSSVVAGSPDTSITISGSNFTSQSTALWNGVSQTTNFINSQTLSVAISAKNLTVPGPVSISIQSAAGSSVVSVPITFVIASTAPLYFPQIAVGGGYTTTITVVNKGKSSANGLLTLTDQAGNPLTVAGTTSGSAQVANSVFAVSVPPGGESVFDLNAADVNASVQSGWARLDSDNSDLAGVATIRDVEGSEPVAIVDVPPAQLSNSVTIPIDSDSNTGRTTGFAIANPNATPLNVRILILDPNGTQVDAINPPELNPIGAGQQVAEFVDSFLGQRATFTGSMVLTAQDQGDQFVSTALMFSPGVDGAELMSVLPADSMTSTATRLSALYFPVVVVGGDYTTTITITNTGTSPANGSLTLTDSTGNPLVAVDSGSSGDSLPSSSFPFAIPAGGDTSITLDALNLSDPAKSGWARVDSDSDQLTGVASFQMVQNGMPTLLTGALPSKPASSATIPIDNDANEGRRTSFAVANEGAQPINITILVFDQNGVQVDAISPSELNPLPPGQQVARFLDEYLPQRASFEGSMVLVSQSPDDQFVTVATQFSSGLSGLLMSMIPIVL